MEESIPWLILGLPLLTAAAIHLGLKNNQALSALVSTCSAAVTLILTLMIVSKGSDLAGSFTWVSIAGFDGIEIGYEFNQLARGMMLVVTGVGFLVHLFSLAYMREDSALARYFCGLSLFMFSMTGIVLASNFIMMFIFWELVGLSSYLLIGHWYQKDSAADAAKKAFLTNRIGDFGFMIGILMLWGITGSFTFNGVSEFFAAGGDAKTLVPSTTMFSTAILLIFMGAMGKSAQAPLHVWLPDAMEGPTPVSALIHAATMVAAGVFMMVRFFSAVGMETLGSVWGPDLIAWIGAITSLLAALMATQQDDIKKILAYSTLSQLGYMVMAVGLLDPEAGMFHLFTHAWFKALLFLGSGAVIFACHHEQNIWKMGGLKKTMPITFLTFGIGTIALCGVPGTAGFFSKEHILESAAHSEQWALFGIAALVACLTTFYMFRLFFVAFMGNSRSDNADHAKEVGPLMSVPLVLLAIMAIFSGYQFMGGNIAPLYKPFEFHPKAPAFIASILAVLIGFFVALTFYFKAESDPFANKGIFKVFRNKFYIDEFYAKLVGYGQDTIAAFIHFFDELIINGLIVGGFSRAAGGFGRIFGRLQSGNLQGYAVLFGLGVLLVIYLTVFVS
ncbi:MAG: NADH-quinone oxidoreductase subunit L [Akkermansiaceae bacterium]